MGGGRAEATPKPKQTASNHLKLATSIAPRFEVSTKPAKLLRSPRPHAETPPSPQIRPPLVQTNQPKSMRKRPDHMNVILGAGDCGDSPARSGRKAGTVAQKGTRATVEVGTRRRNVAVIRHRGLGRAIDGSFCSALHATSKVRSHSVHDSSHMFRRCSGGGVLLR